MKTACLLSLLLGSLISFSQKSPKTIEAELIKQFEKIWYWDEHNELSDTIDTYDSVQTANDFILKEIVKQGKNNPAFLSYPFKSLSQYLDVLSSKDNSLRIYSWDTYTGGTMHIFYAVAQYLGTDKKVYTYPLSDTSGGDPGLWYSEIYNFNSKGKKYYLLVGNGIYSTRDMGQEVLVYTIKGDRLVPASIIKTKEGLTNSIHISYDLSNLSDPDRTKTPSIDFDETNNELKIPVVDDKGKMLGRNIIYKFKGEQFEKTGIK